MAEFYIRIDARYKAVCTCREVNSVRYVNNLCPTHGDKSVAKPK